ncbi:MAG: hypothetical protein ACRD0P_00855 [Stackebrandtia sp.]
MKLGNRTRKLVLFGAAAIALTGIGTATAMAAEVAGTNEQIATKRGQVYFYEDGDKIAAIDTRKDGYNIQAQLKWDGAIKAQATTNGGYGDEAGANPNVAEGKKVGLRMCYIKNGNRVKCSMWQHAHA